jgi:hypothetical protein
VSGNTAKGVSKLLQSGIWFDKFQVGFSALVMRDRYSVPILVLKKLRYRKNKWFAQSYSARKNR